MSQIRKTLPLVSLILTLLGVLFATGVRVYSEKLASPLPRVLSIFTQVPDGFNRVIDVIDGDTIVVEIDGKEETIRFLGVDTPETKDPRKPVQCFGKRASEFTQNALQGKSVKLIKDPSDDDRDSFNRMLRYIYLEDGTMLNELLVKEGYAFAYEKYPTARTAQLKKIEQEAREQGRGLWGECKVTIKNKGKLKKTEDIIGQ